LKASKTSLPIRLCTDWCSVLQRCR